MFMARLFVRRTRSTTFYPLAILALVHLSLFGCGKATQVDPSDASASTSASSSEPKAALPSQEEIEHWLTAGVPPLADEIADAPVKLLEPTLEQNEFGQEILSVRYDRPKVVRTMASELTLVLLPTSGGRADVYVAPGMLVQPQSSGKITGITAGLLDYRGHLRSGMRAYLEMRAATIGGPAPQAQRVSEVIWLGSNDQLAAAIQKGSPAEVSPKAAVPEPALQPAPSGKIAKGTPLWMRCGDRWAQGHALEDSDGDKVRLLMYLVRRDKPYQPWVVDLPRSQLRIEKEAVSEFQRDPNAFHDLADADQSKLSRHGVPNKLEPVDPNHLPEGTAVLDFWNGMLDPCRTTGDVKDGAVPIQRVGLDNAQMVKSAKELYLDPFGG